MSDQPEKKVEKSFGSQAYNSRKKAILDSNYTVVVNYECSVEFIEIPNGAKVLVQAPGVPVTEVSYLRNRVDAARLATKQEDRLVVTNYEVYIDAVPA